LDTWIGGKGVLPQHNYFTYARRKVPGTWGRGQGVLTQNNNCTYVRRNVPTLVREQEVLPQHNNCPTPGLKDLGEGAGSPPSE
jgi:hypothetical protein